MNRYSIALGMFALLFGITQASADLNAVPGDDKPSIGGSSLVPEAEFSLLGANPKASEPTSSDALGVTIKTSTVTDID